MTFRKIVFWSHLLAGVCASLVIFSMSFTGVMLMYEPHISDYSERSARWVLPNADAKRLSYTNTQEQVPGWVMIMVRFAPSG